MAQNIRSAAYKVVGGWEYGWGREGGWWAQVTIQTQCDQCCAKGAVSGLQTILQGKAGLSIRVMDDCMGAVLIKPTSIATVLCMRVAIKVVNIRDSNSCTQTVDFLDLVTITLW